MEDELFQGLEHKIADMKTYLEKLRRFRDVLHKNDHAFDSTDIQIVDNKIEQFNTQMTELQERLDDKRQIYASSYKQLTESMEERKRILEMLDEETGVLQDNQDLMEKFLEKQTELAQVLESMKQKLIE